MPRTKTRDPTLKPTTDDAVATLRHATKRKNIPPAGLEAQGRIEDRPKLRYDYNPHLPPVLRSAPKAAETDELVALLRSALARALGYPTERRLLDEAAKRPLTGEELRQLKDTFEAAVTPDAAQYLAEALRRHEPWLEWSGKREKPWFEVDPVALHIHERVSTQAILRVLAREDVQRDLFADPQLEYHEAVRFYQHDVDWANRLVLGDSLAVMASLARREDLAGKVQMIYVDPPYGIKFSSNFQPQLGSRDVKDREQDLTREPEMVKAYRDTWTLGIHSYLAYLRDRLAMAKELLAHSGSIFVQISDENLHRVRCIMDEVFQAKNFVSLIQFTKTSSASSELLPSVCDYLLWYASDVERVKYREIFRPKAAGEEGASKYSFVELPTGERCHYSQADARDLGELSESARVFTDDQLTSQRPPGSDPFEFQGAVFSPLPGYWKTSIDGLHRLANANRVMVAGKNARFVRYLQDFPVFRLNNTWADTGSVQSRTDPKVYVVQTAASVLQRCLLMTTDPGDLVLDPTCGSGTTAYVAEQWGRRWITIDTSRVALALAKQRLMTARFPYYKLRELSAEDLARNPDGAWLTDPTEDLAGKCTFQCKTVPHVTLKSIARNASLDPIFEKHEPVLAEKLAALNAALGQGTPEIRRKLATQLAEKQKREGKRAVTEADRRRWSLPQAEWNEWEVPFDTDPDWPEGLQQALTAYRQAWRAKMDEVNVCIAANAEVEELVDKPEELRAIVRVAGPFTVEGVIALEEGPETPIGGAPEVLESFQEGEEAGLAGDIAVANAEAHLDKVLRLLKAAGVDFPGNKNQKLTRLEPITGAALIHAEGEWANGANEPRQVAVSVGPEVGNVTNYQVEEAVRAANRRGYDDLVFAGFGFDAAAQDAIEEASHPNLRVHMALIRPDVAMGELLKTQPGSQIFTVFSAPRVKPPERQPDGQYVVEVEGMDVYDPVSNTLFPTDKERIAAWFLDSDYDGRTFCISQAFFPDRSKWDKLARALGERGVIEPERFEALAGLRSLPFPLPLQLEPGREWRIAVKVIDPRGNEGLRVVAMPPADPS